MKKWLIITFLVLVLGCQAPTVQIHAIRGEELEPLKKGQAFTAPCDGWFVSNRVMKKVMKSKVD